jgi:AmmeMemoRadiSam system protein B/AmmeMemoRadiSam system protein A
MNIFTDARSGDREPVAAGRFYPADKETLQNDIASLFSTCTKSHTEGKVRAIISPHAGYVFSGKIAASAFSAVQNPSTYKNIFIIGSSHVMSFDGASVYDSGDFISPLGRLKVNIEIAKRLKSEGTFFNFPVTAHYQEHSIEVQIPFIQYHFKNDISIVPVIIGTNNISTIKEIAASLKTWFIPENLFLISSDFSHYPSYKDANKTDKATSDAILTNNSENFLKIIGNNASKGIHGLATSMCGWTSGLTLIYLTEENMNLKYYNISYCNSGDSHYGNKEEVVGYHAIEIVETNGTESKAEEESNELKFTDEESQKLISIARNSIRAMLFENKRLIQDSETLPPIFKINMGAFVTIKIDGKLKGCIGRFTSPDPLYQVVSQMSIASAFDDTRFTPVTKTEFGKIEIEISVLGPLRKISSIGEIIIGMHGVYIKKDFRTGTMLPQVATENGWTVEQFLGYTSRDKAGLGWTGWKEAEIYIYEAAILKENKKP